MDRAFAVLAPNDSEEFTKSVVAAIAESIPEYSELFASDLGGRVRRNIGVTLNTFITAVARMPMEEDRYSQGAFVTPALDIADNLGRHEAKEGRPVALLLSAFHIGARTLWGQLAAAAASLGSDASTMAQMADALFDFVDRLSTASVAGYEHEVATSVSVVERERESLARALLVGLTHETAARRARQARWSLPQTLTPIVVSDADSTVVLRQLPSTTLVVQNDLPGEEELHGLVVLVSPNLAVRQRELLLQLAGVRAVVGVTTSTLDVAQSYRWARRLWINHSVSSASDAGALPLDAEHHLADVIVGADLGALEELRSRVLAPLSGVPAPHKERLMQTLRLWLLHRGRRDLVAAALFVHPQTVRYRLTRLRDLFGDVLNDPNKTLELLLCLSEVPSSPEVN
ncbi:PucR family transcriptional regulator [Streptomyces chartreusis]|uniref:PucR family transcriptional regulator n=1 Tax=Streptomyces chartreusis TaxID=1969 RepID=UPI0033F0BB41